MRCKNHKEGVHDDNTNQILLKPEYFELQTEQVMVMIEGEEKEWLNKIKKMQEEDKELTENRKKLEQKTNKGKEWSVWNISNEEMVFNEG